MLAWRAAGAGPAPQAGKSASAVLGLTRDELAQYVQDARFAKRLDALPPTPMGTGHLGRIRSGQAVHVRFPVPRRVAGGYWLHLGNVVGFSGKGSSYQLLIRRDAPDGPVVFTGPVISDGDAWNAENRRPIDIGAAISGADRKRGALDLYLIGKTRGDAWTVYRHNRNRPIFATTTALTPEIEARIALTHELARRGIALLPLPRQIRLLPGPGLRLRKGAPIRVDPGAAKAAETAAAELRAVVAEHAGIELGPAGPAETAPIRLRLAAAREREKSMDLADPQGYILRIDSKQARITAGGPAGLFYGALTLAQLLAPAPAGFLAAPACEIRDRPAFPLRIVQYDIARGQTVNVAYVKRLIRAFARCKLNAILFYMEDDFKFKHYPFLGRAGTFTPAKARALSEYAHRFHMQLIPQFESLGHAGAVLRHPELKDLRENGNAWDFCTTNPKTWTFLDTVFGELCEAFPYTPYLHVGADEFETAFGKCPRCRAYIEKHGIGGLYALHMNRLNRLVRKHGRIMLFWPSHTGPSPALSRMTIQYAAQLDKSMIPTEWIYHGPPAYPTIDTYRKLGFADVFCAPAVVDYSRVWPDYATTFRGIRGFFRYGAERGCGGAYCTTWEFMHGALVENSLYGLLYAAECAWNPFDAVRFDFDRRFGAWWFGLGPDDARTLAALLYDPIGAVPRPGASPAIAGYWRGGRNGTRLLWLPPARVLTDWALRTPQAEQKARFLDRAMTAAIARLDAVGKRARRHPRTLQAARLGFAMLRFAAEKALGIDRAAELYAAQKKHGADSAGLSRIAAIFTDLSGQARSLARQYADFIQHCGAYAGDAIQLLSQARQAAQIAASLQNLAARAKRWGKALPLPPARRFGLLKGRFASLGKWTPATVSEKGSRLEFPLPAGVLRGRREIQVGWNYTRGAHGLTIRACRLAAGGKTVAEDRHEGWAGSGSHDNVYTLAVPRPAPAGPAKIVADVVSSGGHDSYGEVWLLCPDE